MNMNHTSATTAGGIAGGSAVSPELLSVRDLATLLGRCSTRHLYRLVDTGRMPAPVRLGRLVRWRRAEVLEWIANGCPPVRVAKGAAR
jgi:excisionase family DNA binding protein